MPLETSSKPGTHCRRMLAAGASRRFGTNKLLHPVITSRAIENPRQSRMVLPSAIAVKLQPVLPLLPVIEVMPRNTSK